jgi:hypothetical protein
MTDYPKSGPPPPHEARITRTATEARQGEIILGKWGRWIWIAAFAVMILFLIFAWI